MNVSKDHKLHELGYISLLLILQNIFWVCDVEGSGIGDCEENVNCCEQSICDIKHNPESNPDKRCCTREEMKEIPPWLCELCIECCDEEERNQTPFPIYCSKCSRCDPGNI